MWKEKTCILAMTTVFWISGCGDDSVEPPKPVLLRGTVVSTQGDPIAAALVVASDVNDIPVTGSTRTDATGHYELDVSAARDQSVKLRAAAAGFATFPSGIQRSLPVNLATAVLQGEVLVVSGAATEISLVSLENPTGLGSFRGTVPGGGGALIVAEGPSVGSSVCDLNGDFVVFNLLPGTYEVRAYLVGLQFQPRMVTVEAAQDTASVALAPSGPALGSVTGNVNIVNAGGSLGTSIVLVVASTFNENLARGEVPPGLRAPRLGAPNVSGSFVIAGVPDGTYKVLAAFENDGLVRDPDLNIAGTQIVEVSVAGGTTSIPTSFKITGALAVHSPGAEVPELVSEPLVLVWEDDSSEDAYSVEVYDARGNTIWSAAGLPPVSGSATVSATYAGPALQSGHTYQFRATSWKSGVPISHTEDLRGLFVGQ